MLPRLLECGVPLEARDGDRATAFLHACSIESIEVLVAAGCNVLAVNRAHQNGLMMAAAQGHATLLPRLLKCGVPLEARDDSRVTAFLFACDCGHAKCTEVLVAAGCNVAAVDKQGKTGLMIAAARGHAKLLPRLVECGVPLEVRDKQDLTAFLHACREGQPESVKALLAAGCDATSMTSKGRTGLKLAKAKGHMGVLHLLATDPEAVSQAKAAKQRQEAEQAALAPTPAARKEAEQAALRAEAELMAIIEGEKSGQTTPKPCKQAQTTVAASAKKRAKRERQRLLQRTREAAAAETELASAPEPAPDYAGGVVPAAARPTSDYVAASIASPALHQDDIVATAETPQRKLAEEMAAKKKAKRERQRQRRAGEAEGRQPKMPAATPEPEPEAAAVAEPEPAPVETAAQRETLERSVLLMREWDAKQVLAWCATQLPGCVAGAAAKELEDGEELAGRMPRSLLKMPKRHGASEAQAQALVACRDAVLAGQECLVSEGPRGGGAEEASAAAGVDPCDICFEPYDRRECTPRMLKECGHTFCAPSPRLPRAQYASTRTA